MSLQSEYLMTSKLRFGLKTLLYYNVALYLFTTVDYYVPNNYAIYVLLIDASKAFDRLCHSKLFKLLESYNVCSLLDDYYILFIIVLKCMYNFLYTME